MTKRKAAQLARQKMNEHGLTDWTFKFDRANTSLGYCDQAHKIISISKNYLHIPDDEILDTILHEIAHALVGPEHHHDEAFYAKCREIGARPERCAPTGLHSINNKSSYRKDTLKILQCPKCKREVRRYRLRNWSCGKCSPKVYNPEYKLVLVKSAE